MPHAARRSPQVATLVVTTRCALAVAASQGCVGSISAPARTVVQIQTPLVPHQRLPSPWQELQIRLS